jgi:hypothetical protein
MLSPFGWEVQGDSGIIDFSDASSHFRTQRQRLKSCEKMDCSSTHLYSWQYIFSIPAVQTGVAVRCHTEIISLTHI